MRIKNLWAVAITVCTLLSCSDSDNSMNEPIVQGKKAAITVKIKGSTVTRAQTGEEAGSADENAIKSLEFFVFNSDGSYQKYFKPEVLAANNQYTFLVDAGNLTVLTAVNQNLGEPSPRAGFIDGFQKK